MKNIIVISIFMLLPLALYCEEKKSAALAPIATMGDLDEIQKRIVFNRLQESISKYYLLSSQKMYEKAEEEAFQQMDATECTENQCIAIIQELLQVEYFFIFELIKSGKFQQMKISRVDLDGNRDVRTSTCDNCDIGQVNNKIDSLVKSLDNSVEIQNQEIVKSNQKKGDFELWSQVRSSNNISEYSYYLNEFPNGKFVDEARKKINVIEYNSKIKQVLSDIEDCSGNGDGRFFDSQWSIPFAPYGVDQGTGKPVYDGELAKRLYKRGTLSGVEQIVDPESDRITMNILMSASTYGTTSVPTSAISGTSCLDYWDEGHPSIKKYISYNQFYIQENISSGKINYLLPLLSLKGCEKESITTFSGELKNNYNFIYNQSTYPEIQTKILFDKINKIIESNEELTSSCYKYTPSATLALNY